MTSILTIFIFGYYSNKKDEYCGYSIYSSNKKIKNDSNYYDEQPLSKKSMFTCL